MARVHEVKHARKTIRGTGIKKGDPYYWWKFRYGPKHVSKTYPKRSQTTQSDFYVQVYDLEDRIGDLKPGDFETADDLKSELDSIAEDIRALGEEQDEKFNNMPEGLQQGDTGQLLEERRDACESWADEIEGIEVDEIDEDVVASELKAEGSNAPTEDDIADAMERKTAEAVEAAISEAQAAESPS